MPDEVRFYVPQKMEDKLLQVFDFGHIETFKKQFSQIDIDSSGDISDREMRVLLEAMKIKVDDKMFKRLVQSIDLNGNGSIEFDEFCYMVSTNTCTREFHADGILMSLITFMKMYCILGNDTTGLWKDLMPSTGAAGAATQIEEAVEEKNDETSSIYSSEFEDIIYNEVNKHAGIFDLVNKAAEKVVEKGSDYSSSDDG